MANRMQTLAQFRSPADQALRDLSGQPEVLKAFTGLWSDYLDGITRQAIVGNPWQMTNSADSPSYYNPLTTEIPADAATKGIQWSAMPGRIGYYNQADWGGDLTPAQINQLADFGWQPGASAPNRQSFPDINTDPCSGQSIQLTYGPYGPRGWQDEYCEWSVQRDPVTQKILRIDFTCENPEYWFTLWRVAPDTVLALYRSTLGNPSIQPEDLWLKDARGEPVIDPSTGNPAYNPLNPFNCGPVRGAQAGGAMHLTSTPNTLQTEIAGLAGAATLQRVGHPTDPEQLLCCAQFGQPHRNSDPHIGLLVNLVVGKNNRVTITDPPGLYIQQPDFSQYALPLNAPKGATPADYWTIKRGSESLNDMYGNPLPGNYILHAVYEVPAELGFTVGDITIGGTAIAYGAQVAATFLMQINATPIPVGSPFPTLSCAGTPANPTPQPLQMMFTQLWNGYYGSAAPANPVGVPMVLASNTVILPPTVAPGQSGVLLSLVCVGAASGPGGALPTVAFDGPAGDVTVQVLGLQDGINYTVPGNSYPSTSQVLSLMIAVAASAQPGLRGVTIANPGQAAGEAAPAFLRIGA